MQSLTHALSLRFTPTRVGKTYEPAMKLGGLTRFTPTRVGKTTRADAPPAVAVRFTPTRVGKTPS